MKRSEFIAIAETLRIYGEWDKKLYALAGLYAATVFFYAFFEMVVINYRPIIEAGAEGDIIIKYRGEARNLATLLIIEGIAGRPTDRMIKITIKR